MLSSSSVALEVTGFKYRKRAILSHARDKCVRKANTWLIAARGLYIIFDTNYTSYNLCEEKLPCISHINIVHALICSFMVTRPKRLEELQEEVKICLPATVPPPCEPDSSPIVSPLGRRLPRPGVWTSTPKRLRLKPRELAHEMAVSSVERDEVHVKVCSCAHAYNAPALNSGYRYIILCC